VAGISGNTKVVKDEIYGTIGNQQQNSENWELGIELQNTSHSKALQRNTEKGTEKTTQQQRALSTRSIEHDPVIGNDGERTVRRDLIAQPTHAKAHLKFVIDTLFAKTLRMRDRRAICE